MGVGNTIFGEHFGFRKNRIMQVFHNRMRLQAASIGPIDGWVVDDDVAALLVDEIGDWLGLEGWHDGVVGWLEWLVLSRMSRSGLVVVVVE